MKKILIVFGTRPEAIKMAPVVEVFQQDTANFETKVCVTAQHRELLDQVMDFFQIKADYDLNLMRPNQNLYDLTAIIISGMKEILETFNPDFVFVHGDTTTSMAVSLAAFYNKTRVCHVEAGLRTYNKYSPFPEEINRQITGRLANFHFAPTETSKSNLLKENVSESSIYVTGNTVIDALLKGKDIIRSKRFQSIENLKGRIGKQNFILVTGHRRENHGEGFKNIILALKKIAADKPHLNIIYPVHPNPNVKKPVQDALGEIDNIILIDPQPYEAFIWLMDNCELIITDSGGVQEEAPSLGKPVLVMRDTTERPEALEAGTVFLVGTNVDLIYSKTKDLLENKELYKNVGNLKNPYGDGNAADNIFNYIINQHA